MNVPDVVKTAMKMKAVIATEGPAIHSQGVTPRKPGWDMDAGASGLPRMMWMRPRGSLNQLGPLRPNQARNALTAPVAENRNSHSVVMATELVTEGK